MKKIVYLLFFIIIISLSKSVYGASVQTGKFSYMPAFADKAEEVYYYSDDYFDKSGKEYNEHLLTMSLNLALSTFEIRNATYVTKLYNDIGFKDISVEDMLEKPTLDTIGTAIAHKKVGNSNILAVAIRGEKYYSEWGNNFIVGKEGNAKGFNDASIKVINRIKEYITTNNLDNVKIWLTGYSRAGAVADLTGVYINNHLQEFNIASDDIYVYTFETPAASIDNTVYDNIYTVVNKTDLIPFVYPKNWGFYTNGKVIEINEASKIKTYTGLTEQTEYSEVDLNKFLNEFINWLSDRLPREVYAENLEEPVSELLDFVFSKSDEDRAKLLEFFTEDVKSALLDNEENKGTLISNAWTVLGHKSDYMYNIISNVIIKAIQEARENSNKNVLTDSEFEKLKGYIYPIINIVGPILVDDDNYYEGINYDEYYAKYVPDYYLTDSELGTKYGEDMGRSTGYDHGFEGSEKDLEVVFWDDNGPEYEEAYNESYTKAYLEYYDKGVYERQNLLEKAEREGAEEGSYNGLYAASNNDEKCPEKEWYYYEDWMTDEYITAYNEAYTKAYLEGYDEGLVNPVIDDFVYPNTLELYHFATILKNYNDILKNHHPQTNIKLVQAMDSYYDKYEITEGNNQTINVEKDEVNNVVIKCNGDFDKFIKILVDGKEVEGSNYTAEKGSTIIKLKADYLKTLYNGKHSIKLVYVDSSVDTSFVVEGSTVTIPNQSNSNSVNTPSNPKTGDNIIMVAISMITSVIGLVITIANKKRVNS